MSTFRVNVVARNPKSEELATKPLEALVDTGSELRGHDDHCGGCRRTSQTRKNGYDQSHERGNFCPDA